MECREALLEKAIILFSEDGCEKVTMKDIAVAANIDITEIYNHFAGKDAILEAIYDRYKQVLMANKPTPEQYIPILASGTAEDILNIFNFLLPEPFALNFSVVKIVSSRKLNDERAKALHIQYSWNEALKYVSEVLTKGIEIGRISIDRKSTRLNSSHT